MLPDISNSSWSRLKSSPFLLTKKKKKKERKEKKTSDLNMYFKILQDYIAV